MPPAAFPKKDWNPRQSPPSMHPMRRMYIPALLVTALIPLTAARHASAAAFPDVDDAHPYAEAIGWLKQHNHVSGFADGSFRPERTVSRAEALKLIMSVAADDEAATCDSDSRRYADVPADAWFAPFVCAGVAAKVIEPGEDARFRPADPINVAELSAILARAEKLEPVGTDEPWFAPSIRAVGRLQAIPTEVRAYGEHVTRGQLAEMVWRIERGITDRPAANPEGIIAATCVWFEHEDIPGVDDQEVARHWAQWVNGERRANGLAAYRPDKLLSRTAALWSMSARDSGTITHKRPGQTAYYDYGIMTGWFEDNGIVFASAGGTTFTENIGWGVYRCPKTGDCTGAFIDAVRTTFDFYMSEKGKAYRPHYNGIVNQDFELAGLGIAVDERAGKYYLTAHYGTALASAPDPVCP